MKRRRIARANADRSRTTLRAAGYRTILSGKMHFCGPDQLHGFEERLTTDIYPADFNGAGLGSSGRAA